MSSLGEPPSHDRDEAACPEEARTLELNEDQTLAELKRADVSAAKITLIAKSAVAKKNRKVALAIVIHPRTPRHVSIPLLRRMFTFDLMQVTVTPAVPADIKRAAEDQILLRVESLAAGEKISLAKRASGRVAAALLQDEDERVITPALDNSQLTETLVVQALMKAQAPEILHMLASAHRKWSQRREVQIALLRSEKMPVERVKEFAQNFSEEFLAEVIPEDRLRAILNP